MRRCGSRVHGCCRCESVRVSASLGEMEVMNDPTCTTYHVACHVSHARCCPKKVLAAFPHSTRNSLFILLLLVRCMRVHTHTLNINLFEYMLQYGTNKILFFTTLHIPTRWCAPLIHVRHSIPDTRYLCTIKRSHKNTPIFFVCTEGTTTTMTTTAAAATATTIATTLGWHDACLYPRHTRTRIVLCRVFFSF